MSVPLEVRPFDPAFPGTLAAALLDPEGPAGRLLPPAALAAPAPSRRAGRRSRVPATAFGSSGPEARERLERILGGDGLLVTTGQQPVVFLGPLYVLYKALSAIELARRLEAATGRPTLALFWVASDDHDWAEIGRVRLVDSRNELRELQLEPPSGWAGRPVGLAPLPETVSARMDELFQCVPDSEFVDIYLELFRDTWTPGRSLGEAFAAGLAGVLEGRSFAWLDAGHPELKRAAAPLFERALREPDGEERALAAGAAAIEREGHAPPIPVLEGATNVFYDSGTARERLYRDGSDLRIGSGGETRSLEEVLDELAEAPERFGPNVALRPVLESWLLPVEATVLGPGELAYWSQLPELFSRHGAEMPGLRPRHGWLLVEGKVAKVLEKLGVEPEAFADGGEEVGARAVRESRPAAVERSLQELREAIGRGMKDVEGAVAAHLPGIRSAVGKAKSQVLRATGELEARVDARLRERREVELDQIRKAALHLFPDRRPQERIQSPLYYLARYGPELVDLLERRGAETTPSLWPEP